MFPPIVEREGEGNRNTDVRQKYQLVVCCIHCDQGSNLHPFGVQDNTLTHWATSARAQHVAVKWLT